MKKFELNATNALVAAIIIGGGSFVAGQTAPQVVKLGIGNQAAAVDFNSLETTYEILQRKFDGDVNGAEVLDGARAGIMASTKDPYTVYLPPKEAQQLADDLAGKLSGIGAEIGIKAGKLTVIAPIIDAPAEKAGIKAGDWIAKINDEDTAGLPVDQAVSKIRGDKDTQVKLLIVRGAAEPKDYTITRAEINVPSVKWSMKNGNVAHIQVTRFASDTSEKLDQAASELKAAGATRVILDLRNDPGGYLATSVDVASEFLSKGKLVVEERSKGKARDKLNSTGGGDFEGMPTVVLINEGSASASEIVAGALQDHKVAKIIGEKSYGKGSVQEITKLAGGAQLKITVAHWYTPNGKNISKEGIKPDVEVKLEQADYDASRDPQLDRALAELK